MSDFNINSILAANSLNLPKLEHGEALVPWAQQLVAVLEKTLATTEEDWKISNGDTVAGVAGGDTVSILGGDNVNISQEGAALTINVDGVNLSAGDGIVIADDEISHADTTDISAVTNLEEGRVLSKVTVDGFGHLVKLNSRVLTSASLGAEPAFSKNSGFNNSYGDTAGTVAEGTVYDLIDEHSQSLLLIQSGEFWNGLTVATDAGWTLGSLILTTPLGLAYGGVPLGGTTGQVLTKDSNLDHDSSWQDVTGGPPLDVREGGVSISNPTDTINFEGAGVTVNGGPSGQANVVINGETSAAGARVLKNATQTVTAGTWTPLTWQVESFDSLGFFDLADPTYLTIPAGVTMVQLTGGTGDAANVSGDLRLRISQYESDGTTIIDQYIARIDINGDTGDVANLSTGPMVAAEGDVFKLEANPITGRTLDATAYTFFAIEVLSGPTAAIGVDIQPWSGQGLTAADAVTFDSLILGTILGATRALSVNGGVAAVVAAFESSNVQTLVDAENYHGGGTTNVGMRAIVDGVQEAFWGYVATDDSFVVTNAAGGNSRLTIDFATDLVTTRGALKIDDTTDSTGKNTASSIQTDGGGSFAKEVYANGFHGDGSGLTGVSASTALELFQARKISFQNSTTSWADITDWETPDKIDGIFSFNATTGILTINSTGWFEINAHWFSTQTGNNRVEAGLRLQDSVSDVAGSQDRQYVSRLAGFVNGSCQTNGFLYEVPVSGEVLNVQMIHIGAANFLRFARFTVKKVGEL